jgi:hypothetical protein
MHIILPTQKDIVQDVVPDTPMFFKVAVTNKAAPGRILITYSVKTVNKRVDDAKNKAATQELKRSMSLQRRRTMNSQQKKTKFDLRVFYSPEVREPHEDQCQKEYMNPRTVLLNPPVGSEEFDSDWVFLTLYSKVGCVVTINVYFKDEN